MSKLKIIFTDWKILKRILITLLVVLVFRLGCLITVPGATATSVTVDSGSFLGIMNMLGGGGLIFFSIFALGVTPYITASIIIQLLSSDVIPPLARLNKSGERGRVKIEKITRWLAVALAVLEGFAISITMVSSGNVTFNGLYGTSEWVNYTMFTLFFVIGAIISVWLADQITMHGIGNGTSILIFTGIVATIPTKMVNTWNWMVPTDAMNTQFFIGMMNFFFYVIGAFAIIAVIAFFETSERRIPIQQTGRGLNLTQNEDTYMPIKTNPAGVIPVIFASSIMTLPPIIAQFFPDTSEAKHWIETYFSLTHWFGLTLYSVLIVLFTFFYAHVNIKADETADNFRKSGTFIVGIKPGKDTEKYIGKVVTSMSVIGAIVLTTIAILPYLLTMAGLPQTIAIGGTSAIIAISVAIDMFDQLNVRASASDKKAKQIRKISIKDVKTDNLESDIILFED